MKTCKVNLIPMLAMFAALVAIPAYAGGHGAGQLERAGWFCYNTGPHNWVHCLHLDKAVEGKPSVPVKVFSTNGEEFLGSELLLHQDVYAGQPCPQDDLDLWGISADAPDYLACHHFLTTH